MMCPVKLANEMSGLSGAVSNSMTRYSHEADERSRSERAMKLQAVMGPWPSGSPAEIPWYQFPADTAGDVRDGAALVSGVVL
jgi:hypothetical protein